MDRAKKQKEIGGYLELEYFHGPEYHQGALALNCARNCLVYLIEARNIETLWLPSYLCSSVRAAAEKAGVQVQEYKVGPDFLPLVNEIELSNNDYLYLVDYYGQISTERLLELKSFANNRVIVDEVQNFFRMPLADTDTLYCCRKFFGVPDGAYLYTTTAINRGLEVDSSRDRFVHLLGRFENSGTAFYKDYQANDHAFNNEPVKAMSPLTHNLLRGIDYSFVANQRNKNFEVLNGEFGNINSLELVSPNGAYMYPLLIENGWDLRPKLQKMGLYIPTLWPNSTEGESIEAYYTRNILPLPIDQRYTEDDMLYMSRAIKQLLG